ncbi:cyclin-D3-1 [Lathyrus oleraceus]|uniref:B-like cyclin n=1 Tax=Pisum sativum TaxID=3888 RepID=A0A9D4X1X4_PEA|nr:cyclin-D3-1-like [Pisum sativum]KAI5412069.1 hypothetical protein KIW84_056940 [Pisum sativum]
MDSKSGFAELTEKEKDVVNGYFDIEELFMPKETFFRSAKNIFLRRHAVAIISKLSGRIDPDTLIPYLAMNYFDRFFSKSDSILEDVEGFIDTQKVRLIALACLTISAKLRIKDFSIDQFLINHYKDVNVRISHQMVMRTELLILRELEWEILPVTPFTFLDFYYRYFENYGGFKRRCINEIIVQAQGEHTFVDYYPTMITISAFLAASKIAYPKLYRQIVVPFTVSRVFPKVLQDNITVCVDEMVGLCNRLNIRIETPVPSTSKLNESLQNRGKMGMVVVSSEDDDEGDGTPLIRRIQDMNRMTMSSQALKISEGVEEENKKVAKDNEKAEDKAETSGGGSKARIEAIIRQPLETGKAVAGEKMEGYISEIAELEERKSLMYFELKWPDDVPSTEPQSPTTIRSNSIRIIQRAGKKLTCGSCKIG